MFSSSPPLFTAQYTWPSPPLGSDAGELKCQLNLSPWPDAIKNPHSTISQVIQKVKKSM
ncbi:hypothetical protein M5K25_009646 [Dendrobium thyrsiflorum]|uniref:Uncharacterized protein n=1 Tax=Dendrobium thyrsiflorum TaxID=117978 RepID=A0ABD0V709_DENTH